VGPQDLGKLRVDYNGNTRTLLVHDLFDTEYLSQTFVDQGRVEGWRGFLLLFLGCDILGLRLVVHGRIMQDDGKLAGRVMQRPGSKYGTLPKAQRWRRSSGVIDSLVLVDERYGEALAEYGLLVLDLVYRELVSASVGEGETLYAVPLSIPGAGVGAVRPS